MIPPEFDQAKGYMSMERKSGPRSLTELSVQLGRSEYNPLGPLPSKPMGLHETIIKLALEADPTPSSRAGLEALRQERDALRQERDALRRVIMSLRERLDSTHAQSQGSTHGGRHLAPDPYGRWIREHLQEFKKYPNHYVAIDLERGIILAESEGREFSRKFQELIEREGVAGDRYLRTHTSSYLDEA